MIDDEVDANVNVVVVVVDDDYDDGDAYNNSQSVGIADDWSTGISRRVLPVRLDTARQLTTTQSQNINHRLERRHLPDCRGGI